MTFLNSNDLWFSVTSVAGITPDNTIHNYSINVYKPDDTSYSDPIKRFNGSFFYHSTDQKLYFDFLLFNINIPPTFTSGYTNFDNYVIVRLEGSSPIDKEVALFENHKDSGLPASYYKPTSGPYFLRPHNSEIPRIGNNQVYPLMLLYNGATSKNIKVNGVTTYTATQSGLFNIVCSGPNDVSVNYSTNTFTLKYVCAPYFLIWYDKQGIYQSQPFWGYYEQNYLSSRLTNLRKETVSYKTECEKTWYLKSDFVHLKETYRGLFDSNNVYVYDTATESYYKVLVETNTYQENIRRSPFKFDIVVKYDYTYTSK